MGSFGTNGQGRPEATGAGAEGGTPASRRSRPTRLRRESASFGTIGPGQVRGRSGEKIVHHGTPRIGVRGDNTARLVTSVVHSYWLGVSGAIRCLKRPSEQDLSRFTAPRFRSGLGPPPKAGRTLRRGGPPAETAPLIRRPGPPVCSTEIEHMIEIVAADLPGPPDERPAPGAAAGGVPGAPFPFAIPRAEFRSLGGPPVGSTAFRRVRSPLRGFQTPADRLGAAWTRNPKAGRTVSTRLFRCDEQDR